MAPLRATGLLAQSCPEAGRVPRVGLHRIFICADATPGAWGLQLNEGVAGVAAKRSPQPIVAEVSAPENPLCWGHVAEESDPAGTSLAAICPHHISIFALRGSLNGREHRRRLHSLITPEQGACQGQNSESDHSSRTDCVQHLGDHQLQPTATT